MTYIEIEPHPDYPELAVLTRSDGRRAVAFADEEVAYTKGSVLTVTDGRHERPVLWNYLGTIEGRLYFSDELDSLLDADPNPCVIRSVN